MRADGRKLWFMTSEYPYARILCVENDSPVLQTVAEGLKAYPFEVVSAANAGHALSRFFSSLKKFDVVLTDHHMPGMNGLQLVRSLRTMGFKGRVLVMSGNLTASDYRAYQDFSVSVFFQKPFDIGLLAERLLSYNNPSS